MSETTYYQRNRDVILNRAKDYYKNNKERLIDNARDKYRNFSEEEKNKKRKYGKNSYHNMSKEKKQKLRECQKNYHEAVKVIKAESLNLIKNCMTISITSFSFCWTFLLSLYALSQLNNLA